jgi:transposase
MLERIDFAKEAKEYAKRKRIVPFAIMLRVVVYGYMRGFRSVRSIETACRENINFMWLLEGYPAPDHNTVARVHSCR